MIDLQQYGTGKPFTWNHEYLVKLVGTGSNPIVTDPILLNAFRSIDRAHFVPEKYKEFAHHDKSIDIGYGEKMTNPTTIARQLQVFGPRFGGKYLHLGTGTGYVAALLGFVAGKEGKVYSLERVQWLWEQARAAMHNYSDMKQVEILYRDGSNGLEDKAPYDGILYSFTVDEIPKSVLDQLKPGGKLVAPGEDGTLRVIDKTGDDKFLEEIIHEFSFYNYGKQEKGIA